MFTKKRFGLILGLVALALTAVPAFAGAHELTNENGTTVGTGTTVFGTSTNAVSTTPVGILTCKHVEIVAEVTKNDGSTVTATMDGAEDTATECHRTTPTTTEKVDVTPTFEHLHIDTNAGTADYAQFSYVVHFTSLGLTCSFDGSPGVTVVGGGLQIKGGLTGTSPAPCPAGGEFHGTFSLDNEEGSVTVD